MLVDTDIQNSDKLQILKIKCYTVTMKKILMIAILFAILFGGYYIFNGYNGGQAASTLDEIPEFAGQPYTEINGGKAAFGADQVTSESFEEYGELDKLGRCTGALTCISEDTMPADGEVREDISQVHPSGWVSGQGWERCHLVGWQLGAENANERNLITGTHYLNVTGMLPFENQVAEYIRETGNHVMYQVTPIYDGDNLVASGLVMMAYSVEDKGEGVNYNVYCFNAAPGLEIDYASGIALSGEDKSRQDEVRHFVLNTSSMKFHYPSCYSVKDMAEHNKKHVKDSRADLIRKGYQPCGNCEP